MSCHLKNKLGTGKLGTGKMGKMGFFPVLTDIFPFLSRDLLKKSLSLQRQNNK